MTDIEQSFAIFDAVVGVFDKHLTHPRWQLSINPDDPDDDEANGWVGPARLMLAEAIGSSILIRRDGNPAAAEVDFEDFRDYMLWQAMVDLARAEDGVECEWRGCDCDCHNAKGEDSHDE